MQRRPREHDEKHLRYIRGLPCCIPRCGNDIQTEAAHIRYADASVGKPISGIGNKPDDAYTVPLCGVHHREQTNFGNERAWWAQWNINPIELSRALYRISGNHAGGEEVIRTYKDVARLFPYAHI